MCAVGRVVIKVGSSTLAPEGEGLDRAYVDSLMEQIAELRRAHTEVIMVTSGAIAAGMQALGMHSRPADIPSLQASASVGQVQVLGMYAALAAAHGITVGQVLLTRHDTAHRQAYLHARDTLERLLALGVMPVVNENDTVAVEEIRFGDNDTLAALVATMAHADLVVLLTDIEGLYDCDPSKNPDACLVEHVDALTDEVIRAAGGAVSGLGSGGMTTKVEAARVLMRAGIPMVVCHGRRPHVILDAVSGTPVGTLFAAGENALGARKVWIALGGAPKGEVIIDEGAKAALLQHGKSLLPAGVVSVHGVFAPGDAIVLKDAEDHVVARGLSALSSADLEKVKGMKSSRIAEVLPSAAGKTVVHRDHLVVL